VILPRGVPAEEFVIKVQNVVKEILADREVMDKLPDRDLRSYLLGALSRFFLEKMRAKPLVQVLLHHVSLTANKPSKLSKPSTTTAKDA
jgi:hypothetical protein